MIKICQTVVEFVYSRQYKMTNSMDTAATIDVLTEGI